MDQFHLDISLPDVFGSVPGGPFSQFCFQDPITRIPTGDQTLRCLPSLLDYGAATKGFVSECSLSWAGVPADHALISVKCIPVFVMQSAAKTRWICRDPESCLDWLAKSEVPSLGSLDCFHSFVLECQHHWADYRPCSVRRGDRLPLQLREEHLAHPSEERLRTNARYT